MTKKSVGGCRPPPAKKAKTIETAPSGKSYKCHVCSRVFTALDLVEKHCLERHGSKKKFKTITKRNKVFHRAKKTTNEKSDGEDELEEYECAYCKFADRTKNGLKCHLSSNAHTPKDLYERTLRSHQELKKSLPYKCIVCHARFIELPRLERHMASHGSGELLDRCLDFSVSLKTFEENNIGNMKVQICKDDIEIMAENMPSNVIVTDSDSTASSSEDDREEQELVPDPEDDEDYLVIEPTAPFTLGASIFNPLPPGPDVPIKPGVKCFICDVILPDSARRIDHLTAVHKIRQNHHLLSFRFRRHQDKLETVALVARPLKKQDKQRKMKNSHKCADCDRLFNDCQALTAHQRLHEL